MSKETPHYWGHRQRLRQRLAENPDELFDYEILELLLGYVFSRKDTKPIAKALLERFETLGGLHGAREQDLKAIPSVGDGVLHFLQLWEEYWVRVLRSEIPQRENLSSPQLVAKIARIKIGFRGTEEVWLAALDNKNRLLNFLKVSGGTVNQAIVYPREILKKALLHDAAAIILVHNHPGGDPSPSEEDKNLTEQVAFLAEKMGIPLLDHIIVGREGYYSFQENGFL